MQNKINNIYYAFSGKLVGNPSMKINVCETLAQMPEEIINYVTDNCWFFASMEDAWAFTFTGNDLKNQHLIFLSDELLFQEKAQIAHTIAHEIGHVMLKHRNSVLEKQTKEEIKKQEKEADEFAKKYL
jgi:Zn-dependent protease with chaperone function